MGTTQINTGLVVKKNTDGVGTNAQGFRRAIAALFGQSSPGVPIAGRLGSDHLVVAGTSGMSYTVGPGAAVITRTAQGVYLVPLHQSVTVTTDPTGGVNPRIDRIYVQQPDPELDGPTVDPHAVIGVVVGSPAASPLLPALPTGALELARCQVPGNATRTDVLVFTDLATVTSLTFGGTLAIGRGGTGATTKAGARTNIGFTNGTGEPNNASGDEGDVYHKVL
jgi:hypothetical protein